MNIRLAETTDVERMVRLSEAFRASLAGYSPVFWRKAADSFARQVAWFRILVPLEDTIALVAEAGAELKAFGIGRLQQAPPVYAPGGPVCLIDDFCVASDSDWSTVGSSLLAEIEQYARKRGAVLSIMVCPHLDSAKRNFLENRGFEVASEWHVREL